MLWRMRPRPDAASRRLARDLPNRRTGGGRVPAESVPLGPGREIGPLRGSEGPSCERGR